MPQRPKAENQIRVRQVTHYQPTWTETARGDDGAFTIQLILDHGAEEYVLRPSADDAEVLVSLLANAEKDIYFDTDRKVLMFGNRALA